MLAVHWAHWVPGNARWLQTSSSLAKRVLQWGLGHSIVLVSTSENGLRNRGKYYKPYCEEATSSASHSWSSWSHSSLEISKIPLSPVTCNTHCFMCNQHLLSNSESTTVSNNSYYSVLFTSSTQYEFLIWYFLFIRQYTSRNVLATDPKEES